MRVCMHVLLDLSIFNLISDFGNLLIVNQLLTDMTMTSKCLSHVNIEDILGESFSDSEDSNFDSDGRKLKEL